MRQRDCARYRGLRLDPGAVTHLIRQLTKKTGNRLPPLVRPCAKVGW
jgi:hypothetical protein